jgi:lipoate-protein ligase B
MAGHKKLMIFNLGLTEYKNTWDIQKKLVSLRAKNEIDDCLIFTEHYPVITMGRGTSEKNLLVSREELIRRALPLYEIERGGDITFHGPGQLVAYPIIDLNNYGRNMHWYLRQLEQWIILTLHKVNLKAEIKDGLTGVWVNNYKVAAIGVAVKRWISYHGIALNVAVDLNYFKLINPCGITNYPVGSIQTLTHKKYELETLAECMAESFSYIFKYKIKLLEDIRILIPEIS